MKSSFALLAVVFAFLVIECCAQFKTGIKTTYPGGSSGNLVSDPQAPTSLGPNHLDEVAKFFNKTRQAMASGVCYKEVPTASLVKNPSVIPAGNGTNPTMSKIQVCCTGYERNPHVYARCDPICKDNCPNGLCTAPNTCICIPGYVRNYLDKCVATCPLGCGDGICLPDGLCKCKPGYMIEPIKKEFCVPQCSKGCENGICTAPEVCQCNHGYELSIEDICEPKCENCDHGTCTKPFTCNCDPGYLRSETTCDPICSKGCTNGICIAPEVCSCKPGFELDRTGINCVPHCDKPCLNGFCDGNNLCVCNPGYVLDETRPNICKPHCPQGCPNGFCSAPNFCICRAGFLKTGVKGRQQCTPA